jgi:hypothetical protein
MTHDQIRDRISRRATHLRINPIRIHALCGGGEPWVRTDVVDAFIDDRLCVRGTPDEVLAIFDAASDEADLVRRGSSTFERLN